MTDLCAKEKSIKVRLCSETAWYSFKPPTEKQINEHFNNFFSRFLIS